MHNKNPAIFRTLVSERKLLTTNLVFIFYFWLINLWRNNGHMFWKLLETCLLNKSYDRFSGFIKSWSSERNTEKTVFFHISISMKKVSILRKIHVIMCFQPYLFEPEQEIRVVIRATRRKINIFRLQLPSYYILK